MGGMPARPLPGGNGTRDLMDHLDNFTFENAIQHFQAAITLKPTDAIGHEALGRAAWDIGDIHLAASEFGKTVSINPDDPFHRFRLLYAKALLGDNSAISKISHLQRKHPYLQYRFGKIQLGTIIPSSYDTNRGETIEVPYIAVSRSETRKLCPTLTLQSGDVLKLKNAREIGIGLVATKEGIIDSNRKHLGPYCLEMFSPNILAYSGDRALLGLPRGLAVVHEGVVLPGAYFNYYHFLFEALGSLLLNPVRRGYNLVTDAPLKQWQSTLFQKHSVMCQKLQSHQTVSRSRMQRRSHYRLATMSRVPKLLWRCVKNYRSIIRSRYQESVFIYLDEKWMQGAKSTIPI